MNSGASASLNIFDDSKLRQCFNHQRLQTDSTKQSSVTQRKKQQRMQSAAVNLSGSHSQRVLTIPRNNNQVPLRVKTRYETDSFLYRNHETILSQLKLVSPEIKNHLNINYLGVQMKNNLTEDPTLQFKMYDILKELDDQVLRPLFTEQTKVVLDEIGKLNDREFKITDNFRFDLMLKALDIVNDLVASIVSKSKDSSIALFIEQIWKFWVIMIDINTQWQQGRFAALLDIQVREIHRQLADQKSQYEALHEKYVTKMKGNQLRVVMEQKKNQHLKEENFRLVQQLSDLEIQIQDMHNLAIAEGELAHMTNKLRVMDNTLVNFHQAFYESSKQAKESVQNMGVLFKQWKASQDSFVDQQYKKLGYEAPKSLEAVNPLITILEPTKRNGSADNQAFVQVLLSSTASLSGPEIYCNWALEEPSRSHLDLSNDDHSNIIRIVLGIEQPPVSAKTIREAVKITRHLNKDMNQKGLSLLEDSVSEIDLDKQIDIANDDRIGEKLKQYLLLANPLNLEQILYHALRFYDQDEKQTWELQVMRCVSKIKSKWYEDFTFNNLDPMVVYQLVHLRQKNHKESEEASFDYVYKLYLMRPRIFYKQTFQPDLSSNRSPNDKTRTKQTSFFKKQQTFRR